MCCIGLCIVYATTYVFQKVKFEIDELTQDIDNLSRQIARMKREVAKLNRKISVVDNDGEEKK